MSKTRFMIAHGASVVVVRDGKRKPITAGAGENFTEDEIASINRSVPGALRSPINESRAVTSAIVEDDEDAADDMAKVKSTTGETGAPKQAQATAPKPKAKAKAKAAAEKPAEDDDADEDEDI